jgi:1-deoxy-D-xylulose-5-phosphate reductoisomerase
MGPRISIGSATLINKAFEVIELHHLFGLERERIEVVIHPQSLVHSMVEFIDGSVIAQMSPPNMRGAIHYALHHPDRQPTNFPGFDLLKFKELTFEAPDLERFPALELGFRCVQEGGTSGCCLNAADEVAVEAYLTGKVPFGEITRISQAVLDARPTEDAGPLSMSAILAADSWARALAQDLITAKTANAT